MTRIYRLHSLALLPLLVAFCLLGCGPITASQAISDASGVVDLAQIEAEKARVVEEARLAEEAKSESDNVAPKDGDSARNKAILDKARASLRGQLHFELSSAKAYLDKAREEEGYSDYSSATTLAGRAIEFAQAALNVAKAIGVDSAKVQAKAKSKGASK